MKTKLLKRIRATANDLFRVTNIIITNSRVTRVSASCHHQLIGYAGEITTKISHDATSFDSAVDIVTVKGHDFPMKVVGLFGDKDVQLLPCVEGYEGDVWEEDVADLELVKPRFKLPEWKQIDEITEVAVVNG